MTRETKLKLLKAIAYNNAPLEVLQPPKTYVFTEVIGKYGLYKMSNREYSADDLKVFTDAVNDKNRFTPQKDLIITICWREGKTIL